MAIKEANEAGHPASRPSTATPFRRAPDLEGFRRKQARPARRNVDGGRQVVAMLSANHINPNIGAEIYVLDRPPDHHRLSFAEATDGNQGPASDAHQITAAV